MSQNQFNHCAYAALAGVLAIPASTWPAMYGGVIICALSAIHHSIQCLSDKPKTAKP